MQKSRGTPVRGLLDRSVVLLRTVATSRERWTSLTVGSMLALAGGGLWWLLAHADRVALQDHRWLAVVAACTYTALAAVVLPRRRTSRRTGAVVVGALQALMVAEGTTYPDPSLRWVCLAFLTVLPLTAVVLVGRRAAAVSTLVSCLTTLVIAAQLPGTVEVRTYVASTMATLVLVPVLVVGVLLTQLERAQALAHRLASVDPLTGLLNRRGMVDRLPDLVAAALVDGQRISVTVVDVDHFKSVNDRHGHLVGDRVLATVAEVLAATTRAEDVVWRLGGEEIAWAARCHDAGDAAVVARRARAAVSSWDEDGLPRVTVSIGVATSGPLHPGTHPQALLDELLSAADAALYAAKAGGRDRVEVAVPLLRERGHGPGKKTAGSSKSSPDGRLIR